MVQINFIFFKLITLIKYSKKDTIFYILIVLKKSTFFFKNFNNNFKLIIIYILEFKCFDLS